MVAPSDEIGREETKERRALAKAVELAVKRCAKGSGWKISQGVLFRDFEGWFVAAPVAVWVGRRKSQIELRGKPMTLDPIFWEVVETESNVSMPLSFRYFGAWTCSVPAVAEQGLQENGANADAIAAEAIGWADSQVSQFKSWSIEHFLSMLQQHPHAQAYLATVVTTLLLTADYAAASEHCKAAQLRGDTCGFSIGSQSGPSRTFPDLALAWLDRRRDLYH